MNDHAGDLQIGTGQQPCSARFPGLRLETSLRRHAGRHAEAANSECLTDESCESRSRRAVGEREGRGAGGYKRTLDEGRQEPVFQGLLRQALGIPSQQNVSPSACTSTTRVANRSACESLPLSKPTHDVRPQLPRCWGAGWREKQLCIIWSAIPLRRGSQLGKAAAATGHLGADAPKRGR